MLFRKIQMRMRAPAIGILALFAVLALLVSVTVLAVVPAQAQETSLVLERIRAKKQIVEVLDAEGNSLGYGEFRALISTSRGGRISGKVELELPTVALLFNPTDYTIGKTVPWEAVEVVLNGRFEVSAYGQTQTSTGTMILKEGITSDIKIWDWERDINTGTPIDVASLAGVTELRIRAE